MTGLRKVRLAVAGALAATTAALVGVPVLKADPAAVPQTVDRLWADFDPRAEPLDVEVVREWREDGATLRYVLYTVGTFEGKKARMAAYYGFPEGEKTLPAVLHLHGGGQWASKERVQYWTSLGYAAMSINWGEKPLEKEGDPNTDWAGLAAGFLAPAHHNDVSPGPDTLHPLPHPANSSWYLYACAARRALTFLEQQPEVDRRRLGLTGHSMGGRLTVLSAVDPRVKAAVPSVGGSGFLYDALWGLPGSGRHMREDLALYNRTIDCRSYWPGIQCPLLFLGATNDFNSPTELVVRGLSLLPHDEWRLVLAPHMNHRFTSSTFAARPLWFESHLKGDFDFPNTARADLVLTTDDGVPVLNVYPDASKPHHIVAVDLYYGYARDPRNRFWRDVRARLVGDHWEGRCPVIDLDEPLFAFGNVTYEIDRHIRLPRGYDKTTNRLTIASQYRVAYPEDLKAAGVRATETPQRLIDDFSRGMHDWMVIAGDNPHHWYFGTHKLADPAWVGPKGGTLTFEVRTTEPDNRLGVVVETNAWRGYAGRERQRYVAIVPLPEAGWHRVVLSADDFRTADGRPLADWDEITELGLTPANKAIEDDASLPTWRGRVPQLRDLRWQAGQYVPRRKPYLPETVSQVDRAHRRQDDCSGHRRFHAERSSWTSNEASVAGPPSAKTLICSIGPSLRNGWVR